jgi:hypothetical protein
MQQDYICKKNLLKLVESVNTHIYGCDCQVANKFSVFFRFGQRGRHDWKVGNKRLFDNCHIG